MGIQYVPHSNLTRNTDYPDWDICGIHHTPPGEYWGSTVYSILDGVSLWGGGDSSIIEKNG